MSGDEFTDPHGFTGPLPVTSTQRMIPTGDFEPGLSIGELAPDFELPNHLDEAISFHADRLESGERGADPFRADFARCPDCLGEEADSKFFEEPRHVLDVS